MEPGVKGHGIWGFATAWHGMDVASLHFAFLGLVHDDNPCIEDGMDGMEWKCMHAGFL